jgi:hypothetical protein
MRFVSLLLSAAFLFFSCKPGPRAPYAIKDFRSLLRPALTQIATEGYVGFGWASAFIEKHATTAELRQLLQCESPLLRATACRALLRRPDVDHFAFVMSHLGDTARVFVDMGEWGLIPRMVSDDLVMNARWKTEADRQKTADSVIIAHNQLRVAYHALSNVAHQEKYYPFIRAMAIRDGLIYEQEAAWYELARYRRREDIGLIRDAIESHLPMITDASMGLMSDFPDTAYMPLLQKYFRKYLYRKICKESVWNPQVSIFKTIATYKNDSSANILDSLLHRRPFMPCRVDTADLKDQLITAIWDNPCPAYNSLRREISGYMIGKEKQEWQRERLKRDYLTADTIVYTPGDTSSEQVRW